MAGAFLPSHMPTVDPVMVQRRCAILGTRSIKKQAKVAGLTLALAMIDLTTLEGKDSPGKVRSLCRKAARPFERDQDVLGVRLPPVAAVCVYPSMIKPVVDELHRAQPEGRTVRVASVATGFPSGQYPLAVRLRDVQMAVRDGADEIDMVINRGAFLAGRYDEVAREIRETVQACGEAHLKVILETGELETLDNVRRASDLAIENIRPGDFIKTSTGKVTPAATLPVTLVMLEAIRDACGGPSGPLPAAHSPLPSPIGMKPAGGIRTAKTALQYLVLVKETLGDAWLTPELFRFGASSLLNDILRQLVKEKSGVYQSFDDFAEA
ncbi:MAG: deoxyribose-phosphate aldolase [Phycisphaerales bacterium]|nr:deoxyribose-phosphate aldolase [Phycisphaerales bacterium]